MSERPYIRTLLRECVQDLWRERGPVLRVSSVQALCLVLSNLVLPPLFLAGGLLMVGVTRSVEHELAYSLLSKVVLVAVILFSAPVYAAGLSGMARCAHLRRRDGEPLTVGRVLRASVALAPRTALAFLLFYAVYYLVLQVPLLLQGFIVNSVWLPSAIEFCAWPIQAAVQALLFGAVWVHGLGARDSVGLGLSMLRRRPWWTVRFGLVTMAVLVLPQFAAGLLGGVIAGVVLVAAVAVGAPAWGMLLVLLVLMAAVLPVLGVGMYAYADLCVRGHAAWFGDGDVPTLQYDGVGPIPGVR